MTDTRYWYDARVTNVVDGDTIDLDIDLGFKSFRHERVRLYGIDTWELFRGEHRDKGKAAKEYVESLVLGEYVLVNTFKDKQGKYGRYLADIYLSHWESKSLADLLRMNGHEKQREIVGND